MGEDKTVGRHKQTFPIMTDDGDTLWPGNGKLPVSTEQWYAAWLRVRSFAVANSNPSFVGKRHFICMEMLLGEMDRIERGE